MQAPAALELLVINVERARLADFVPRSRVELAGKKLVRLQSVEIELAQLLVGYFPPDARGIERTCSRYGLKTWPLGGI